MTDPLPPTSLASDAATAPPVPVTSTNVPARKRSLLHRYRSLWRDAFKRPDVGHTERAPLPRTPRGAAARAEHAEVLMKAASHHLSRVAALADTEWKVSLAFWATLIASGAALNGAAASDKAEIVALVHANSAVLLAGYLVACTVFLFGFSVNQSQSISTERNRFLYYQGAALVASGLREQQVTAEVKIKPGRSPLSTVDRRQGRMSIVWGFKLLSSTGFALGMWGVASAVAAARAHAIGWPDWRSWAGMNAIASAAIVAGWLKMTLLFFLRALRAKR